jgi:hypothetical protein
LLALFAKSFLALRGQEIPGLLGFVLRLCVKPQAPVDLAQVVMGRSELRIQCDGMLESLSRIRPILFRSIELA